MSEENKIIKEESIKKIEGLLADCSIAIVTDYRGMTVTEMNQLRRQLVKSKTEYHVVKNTLAGIAAERVGREELKSLLSGPSAIAFSQGEVAEPVKIMLDFIKSSKTPIGLKGGLIKNRVLSKDEVTLVSTLPPAQVLVSQVLRQMQAPISSLLTVLNGNMRGLVGVLEARKHQLEGN